MMKSSFAEGVLRVRAVSPAEGTIGRSGQATQYLNE